ncbi:MAG TPA: nitrate- and nitrite sensing domain-containing protein [Streptosporangiaceae bacterium]|nr:nitrate- and nitrite sensing domain-containing protein [Streptosporangiaceae bacterium]
MDNANADQRLEKLADLAGKTNALAHEVERERDLSAAYAATNPDPKNRPESARVALRQAQQNVDDAVQAVQTALPGIDSSYSDTVRLRVRDISTFLDQLPALRQITTETLLPPQAGAEKYSQFITVLLDLNDDVASGTTDQTVLATARAEAALSRAKDQSSLEGAILHAVLLKGTFEPTEIAAFQSARAERDAQLAAFRTVATLEQRQAFDDTVSGPEIDRGEAMRVQAISAATESPELSVRPLTARDADQWFDYNTATIDKMRTAEQQVIAEVVDRSGKLKNDARRAAVIDAALLCLVIVLVLGITLIVAQSLVRPLRRLRASALDIAGNRLPGLVDRLRDPEAAAAGIHVAPIDVDSTDEIGEVARSFDEVHREAVRLASNEALLRGNINAMFVNLSRRSQSLIERQLRLIEDLEQGEQDEDRLASLFKLDHLATRMRRNSENLLVLGGQEQVRRWNQPVPLIDIVRASLSEVEQYERVGLRVQGDVSVIGPVVNDLVHLVAELVENATVFSPEHTRVTVSGHLLSGGGAMLQITDNGVGMAPDELEAVNWRLANPPIIDASAARRMGLYVVGRLAVRNGIRVELRSALSGGLTAFVLMPARVIVQGGERGTGFTPRRFEITESPVQPPVPAAAGALDSGAWGRGAITDPIPVVSDTGPQRLFEAPGPHPHSHPAQPRPAVPERGPWQAGAAFQSPAAGAAAARPPHAGQGGPAQMLPPMSAAAAEPAYSATAGPPPGSDDRYEEGYGDRYGAGANNNGPTTGSWERVESTGPIRREERLPIFDAIESEWFQRRSPGSEATTSAPAWQSPGDEGWRVAEATMRAPKASGRTASGLPKRVPGKNRVPGSVTTAGPVAPPKSAEAMRNRFASFQQGVSRGRAAARSEDNGEIE